MPDQHIAKDAVDAAETAARSQNPVPHPAPVENERFLADLRQFAVDIERLVGQAKALSGEGAAVARGQLERVVTQAQRRLSAARVAATDQALVARDRAERYVREDPWKAIAIAAATGALVALFTSRR